MQTDPIASTVRVADAGGNRSRRGSAADDAGSFACMISAAATRSPAKPDVSTAADGDRDEAKSEDEETRRRDGAVDRETDVAGSAGTGPRAPAYSSDKSAAAAPAASPVIPSAEVGADAPSSPPQPAPAIAGSSSGPGAGTEGPAGNGAPASPPSAQAADLTRVLAAGTRVQVAQAAGGSGPGAAPLAGNSIVALAVGEEAQPAAGRGPTARAPGSTATAAIPVTGDEEGSTAAASAPLVFDAAAEMKGGSRKKDIASPGGQSTTDARGSTGSAPVPTATASAAAMVIASTAGPAAPATATSGSAAAVSVGGKGAAQITTGEAPASKPETAPTQAAAALQVQPQPQMPATTATGGAAASDRGAAGDTTPPPAASQVSIHIAKAVHAGLDRIDIQLSPASLGRVEVRLDIVDRHHVTVAVSADSPDALDALRTNSRLLERALQDAGLKTDAGSLSFHLRDHGARSGPGGGGGGGEHFDAHRNRSATANEAPTVTPAPLMPRRTVGGIDIHA